jgi:hypothetical protein
MIVANKRYLFVTTDDRTFTGLVVNVNDAIVTYKHKADDTFQNVSGQHGEGVYHMPRGFIQRAFAFDELVAGERYKFSYLSRDNLVNVFDCTFKSISGKCETVNCIDDNNNRLTFPLYWIKDIAHL